MRSNQYTTQQVVFAVKDYLHGLGTRSKKEFGTTAAKVIFDDQDNDVGMLVTLFNRPILKVNKAGNSIKDVYVFSGFHYDADGNPTNLTRERVNGLLDLLGSEKVIPQKVRVIYDSEFSVCYLNCQDNRTVLNKEYCDVVGIKADPKEFQFVAVDQGSVCRNNKKE